MNDSADRDLRARFEKLRAADAAARPAFHALVDRASPYSARAARVDRRWLTRIGIPVAIAAGAVLAAGVVHIAQRRAAIQVPLSAWTSPTAGMLPPPGIGLAAPSDVLTSVLDAATSSSFFREGTK